MSSGAVIIFALYLLNYVTASSAWMNYPDKWNTKPRLRTIGGTEIHDTVYNPRPRCTDRPDLYRLHTHQTGIQPEIRMVQNAIHTTLLPHILTMELQFCRTVFQPT